MLQSGDRINSARNPLNPESYIGKAIKHEGIFDPYLYTDEDQVYYYVIRYGLGCCGYDANAAFELE